MSKIHRWVSGMLTIGLAVSALSGCAALEALKEIRGGPGQRHHPDPQRQAASGQPRPLRQQSPFL